MRGSRLALAVAAILVGAATAARLVDRGMSSFPDLQLSPGQSPDAWGLALVAAGGLCIAGLALRRSPWLAWFATGVAAGLGAIDLMGQVRTQLVFAAAPTVPAFVALSVVAATAAVGVTTVLVVRAADAHPREVVGWMVRFAGALAFAFVVIVQAAALVRATVGLGRAVAWDPIPWIRGANRITLGVLAVDLAAAALLVIAPRVKRAWVTSGSRPGGGPSEGANRGLFQALGDEFVPGLRSRGDVAAAAERERLAADLHARVIPELRRAAASTAAVGAAPDADLRGALEDIERLMAERHSVVLEEFGLLAAIEWLAERTTARTGATVEIDVGEPVGTERPPREVERAAFRIALLAIDNVGRHASGATIAVSVAAVSSQEVRLAIADDGPGIDPDALEAAHLDGHRGLSDMDAAARSVGGHLSVSGGADGVGTRVTFSWVGRQPRRIPRSHA